MKRCLLPLLLLLSVSGCGVKDAMTDMFSSSDDNAEPPAPLLEFRTRLNVIELWSEGIGSGTDEQYLKLAPVVANQKLFIVDSDGDLKALDATNGQKLWSAKLKTERDIDSGGFWSRNASTTITGGPGYGENTVLVGTNEGDVVAYAAETGKQLWSAKVSSEVLSAPQKKDNIVVVRTIDGKMFGLEGNEGRRLWIYDRTVPTLSLRGTSAPVIVDDIIIAGFDGGRLAALELRTGRLLWESQVATARGSSELERMVDIDSEPIVIDGVIYVATYQGNVAAIHMESGRILWTKDISTHAGMSADDRYIYLTDDNSHIWAFDRYSGISMWSHEKLHARAVTAPAVIGDYIVVGDFEGYLHWMEKDTGHFVARTQLSDERIIAAPIVVGKILYAFCTDGELAAYTYR